MMPRPPEPQQDRHRVVVRLRSRLGVGVVALQLGQRRDAPLGEVLHERIGGQRRGLGDELGLVAVEDLGDLVLAGPRQQVQVRQRQPALARRRGHVGHRMGEEPGPAQRPRRRLVGTGVVHQPHPARRRAIGGPVAGGVPRRHDRHRVPVDQRGQLTVRLQRTPDSTAPVDRGPDPRRRAGRPGRGPGHERSSTSIRRSEHAFDGTQANRTPQQHVRINTGQFRCS